jgi:DNA-binding transcriptional LysR family regulator
VRASNRSRHHLPQCRDRSERDTTPEKNDARAIGRSRLRLLVDETAAELILKPHIAAFLAAHPSLSVELRQRAWASEDARRDVDLALQYAPSVRAPKGAVQLDAQGLLTCAAPQYLRGRGLPQNPLDLRRQRHDGVVVSDNAKSRSAWKFASGTEMLNVESGRRATAPSLSMALALTLGGAGVSQIPECWAIGHVRSGRLVRLLPEWESSLNLFAFEPRSWRDSNAQALVQFVRTLIDLGAPGRPC